MTARLPALGPRGEGWFLLQVLVFGLIALAGAAALIASPPAAARLLPSVAGAGLIVAGVLVGVRAVRDLGGSFSPFPRPVQGSVLVEVGAYRHVRHPIYSGVILAGVGWALLAWSLPALILTGVLLVLFDAKSRREEAWLLAGHPGYAAYRARTRRFIPRIY